MALQLTRGAFMFATTAIFFLSLSLLPLGTVSALSNANPLFVLLLAGPLLRERVPRLAIVGSVIGFAGVLAITGLDWRRSTCGCLRRWSSPWSTRCSRSCPAASPARTPT